MECIESHAKEGITRPLIELIEFGRVGLVKSYGREGETI